MKYLECLDIFIRYRDFVIVKINLHDSIMKYLQKNIIRIIIYLI